MNAILSSAFLIACSAIVTFVITPKIINRMKARGLVGKDMNKQGKPEVAEMGGIAVLFGFSFAILAAIFVHTYLGQFQGIDTIALAAGFITILLVGFLGVFDDLIGWKKGIRQWQHALIPVLAALPLMAFSVGNDSMSLPIFGVVGFGIFYSLIVVPIGITGAANASNMLAGLNGLETGLGLISTITLLIIAVSLGKTTTIIFLAAIIGALIAFLYFNWHPAKIFPGDSLTLMIGAAIATAVIIGDMEKYGIILFALFFIELLIKARHKFQSENFGIPRKDGTLAPNPKGGSLTHFFMKLGNFSEKKVVILILATQALVAVFTLAVFYLGLLEAGL